MTEKKEVMMTRLYAIFIFNLMAEDQQAEALATHNYYSAGRQDAPVDLPRLLRLHIRQKAQDNGIEVEEMYDRFMAELPDNHVNELRRIICDG